jgi:RNA:NAD 2'-phosphotransferase (TPT1/KptA family)
VSLENLSIRATGIDHNATVEREHLVKVSKRMSKALRHDPDRVGLVLDPAGWTPVDALLAALRIERAELDAVVAGNDKQRFAVERGTDGVLRIRANQGHSVPVDLGLPAVTHRTGSITAPARVRWSRSGPPGCTAAADTTSISPPTPRPPAGSAPDGPVGS